MLDTSLNTQTLYKGIQTAKNNLSELPSQTSISKNQTQKNNVYFMGSSESLAFASNFKAGLNLNNKLIAFKGNDDDNEIIPNTKTTPSAKQTAMALLLLASQILSPTTGNTQQNDTRELNSALYSCSNQALEKVVEENKPFKSISQEMQGICPQALNKYYNLPPEQREIINEHLTAHTNANIEQLKAQAKEQQPQNYNATPGTTLSNYSLAIGNDLNNCAFKSLPMIMEENKQFEELGKKMEEVCPETIQHYLALPEDQKKIIDDQIAANLNDAVNQLNAQARTQAQTAPRAQQYAQPTEQPQTTGRMAQLPPNYRPIIPIDSPNIYLPHKLSDINLKMRKSANTCKDQETQEQCNQRALNTNLQLDSMQIENRQMDERSREITERNNAERERRDQEKLDRLQRDGERRAKEMLENRIKRLSGQY